MKHKIYTKHTYTCIIDTNNITIIQTVPLYRMAITIYNIFSFPTEHYSISITWPPPCTPMHLMEDSLPSLHMATTMYIKVHQGNSFQSFQATTMLAVF